MHNIKNHNIMEIKVPHRIINSICTNKQKETIIIKDYKSEKQNMNIVKILFNNHDYASLRKIIPSMKLTPEDTDKANKILELYENWDKFEYDSIRKYKFDEFPEIFQSIEDKYNENINALKKIRKKYREYQLLIDLINNAKRRNQEGKNNEAILQLYRAMELITNTRLMKVYKIDTSNVDIDRLRQLKVDEQYINYLERFKNKYNAIHISLKENFCILQQLKDPIGKYFEQNMPLIINIIKMRHSSLLVHGTTNITAVQYMELEYIVKELAKKLNKKIIKYIKKTEFPKIE